MDAWDKIFASDAPQVDEPAQRPDLVGMSQDAADTDISDDALSQARDGADLTDEPRWRVYLKSQALTDARAAAVIVKLGMAGLGMWG